MTHEADHNLIFANDEALKHVADGIRDLTLPKAEWTHAGHFAAAIWLLAEPGFDAVRQLPDVIRAYNIATGVKNTDSDGYHETITQASLIVAKHMLDDAEMAEPLYITHARLMAGNYGKSDWILRFWSKDRLFSVAARRAWIEPDLMPLP